MYPESEIRHLESCC